MRQSSAFQTPDREVRLHEEEWTALPNCAGRNKPNKTHTRHRAIVPAHAKMMPPKRREAATVRTSDNRSALRGSRVQRRGHIEEAVGAELDSRDVSGCPHVPYEEIAFVAPRLLQIAKEVADIFGSG